MHPGLERMAGGAEPVWSGPRRRRGPFSWSALLASLVCPPRGNRAVPTVIGVVLLALGAGLGAAAYGSGSNVLFIAVALLLTSLVLGGVAAWLNLRGLRWRLRAPRALRAGRGGAVALELRHAGGFLPVRCVWFDLVARPLPDSGVGAWPAGGSAAAADPAAEGRVALPRRILPGATATLGWDLMPGARGRLRVELARVGSLFPFGFLRHELEPDATAEVIVWPEPVDYRRVPARGAGRRPEGRPRVRAGAGSDLLALRAYRPGDSPRQVHWKASARAGGLLVRQFAAEGAEGFTVWVCPDARRWARSAQFELLLRLAGSLAEDLYRQGRLRRFAFGGEPAFAVRRLPDLERVLDRLALAEPGPSSAGPGAGPELVTFAPEGGRGVAAWLGGERLASA